MTNNVINRIAADLDRHFDQSDIDKPTHGYEWEQKFGELIIQECMDVLRQEWYKENNTVPEDNPRAVAIHVGTKSGLIRASNAVAKHFGTQQ